MNMATKQQVKQYLAYWFQVGKKVIFAKKTDITLPQKILEGDRYSEEFEQFWQYLLSNEGADCYLEGTTQTIKELLSPQWDIISCSRCEMPVPVCNFGRQPQSCPCFDVVLWPNNELPTPHLPIDNIAFLKKIRERLKKNNHPH